ncbi:MAG: AAA family ATPase [Gemmatimonadota bacterium]
MTVQIGLLRCFGTAALLDSPENPDSAILFLGKPLALLIYLSAAPNRTASRSTLISRLWADLEPDAAKHALRQTVWYLRRKTGHDLVCAIDDSLQLVDSVSIDRAELLKASAAGDHETVVSIYTGPFVPDFATPGGSGFEDWAALERRRLLEIFRHSAEALIRERLARGRARDATDLARKLRDQDIYSESAWRLLIEVYTSAGDLLSARAEAEALQQLAESEDFEPEPATLATIRSLRTHSLDPRRDLPTTQSPAPITGTLVGRESAFATLLAAWESAKTGKVTRLHVTARAGIGKSRLLRDFAARVRGMRGKLVTISGSHGTRSVAYALAGDLAAGLAALPGKHHISSAAASTLVGLNPTLSTYFDVAGRQTSPQDALRDRSLSMRELANAVSSENTVAVLVDDLHWCDEESAALLAAFIEGLGDTRLLLVTTGRPEARRVDLVARETTRHLSLDPLTVPQIEELLLSLASLPPHPWAGEFASELWRASRGSPLLALEMLQLLEERGVLQRVDSAWHSDKPDVLSAELRAGDVLRNRLEDMDRFDRWLLTLIAAGGSTLDATTLATAAESSRPDVVDRLRSLEARGLVLLDGHNWQIAHDEITDELLRLTPTKAVENAAAHAGRALATASPYDEARARRAMQILRTARDEGARRDLFLRFVRHRHQLGDRRSVTLLALDLLGSAAPEGDLLSLRRGTPWTWRLGLVSNARRTVAAAGVTAVLAVVGFAILRPPVLLAPDAILGFSLMDSTGQIHYFSADLRESDWTPLKSIETRSWSGPGKAPSLTSANSFNITMHPRLNVLVTAQAVDDSGIIDLHVHEPGKGQRRLASAPGDDLMPSFSPDSSVVVFVTARWDSLSHYDLALAGLDDTVVRQLTSGPASDLNPRWNRSGTTIAFARRKWGERPDEVCIISVAPGSQPLCHAPAAFVSPWVLGWLDDDRLVIMGESGQSRSISVLQWSTGDLQRIVESPMTGVVLSPDARWVVCECPMSADGRLAPAVFPLSAPGLLRPITIAPGLLRVPNGTFWIRSHASLVPDRLRIDAPPRAPVGVPLQLRAEMTDSMTRPLQYHGRIRWTVTDTTAATIDSLSGLFVASGALQAATVRASVGPTRDSVVIRLTSDSAPVAFDEQWTERWIDRWILFGAPQPTVELARGGTPAFHNNGEGSFNSGALSRQSFSGVDGLAIDVDVSTPITLNQWQTVAIALLPDVDTITYTRVRRANASPLDPYSVCEFGYPTEGTSLTTSAMSLASSATVRVIPVAEPGLFSGEWHRVRLQRFPDGRCGLAINGKPRGILRANHKLGRDLRVKVFGNSYKTRVAVGRVKVFEGVPRDIDWTRAPEIP